MLWSYVLEGLHIVNSYAFVIFNFVDSPADIDANLSIQIRCDNCNAWLHQICCGIKDKLTNCLKYDRIECKMDSY